MTPLDWHNKYGAKVFGEGKVAPAAPQQVAPTITESKKLLTNEDRQELSDLEKEMTETNGGSLSDRQKSAIKDREFELFSRRNLEQNHPEIMKLLLEENAGSESDIAKLSKFLVSSMGTAIANVAFAFDKGLISDLELAVIIKRLEAVTDKESGAEFRRWAFSHKNKEIGKAFGELPMSDEMNRHPKAASQFAAKLIPETIAQNKLDEEARAKAKAEKAAALAAPLEQAAMPAQVLEQAATVSATTYSALDRAVSEVTAKSLAASGWKEQIKGWVNKGSSSKARLNGAALLNTLTCRKERSPRKR